MKHDKRRFIVTKKRRKSANRPTHEGNSDGSGGSTGVYLCVLALVFVVSTTVFLFDFDAAYLETEVYHFSQKLSRPKTISDKRASLLSAPNDNGGLSPHENAAHHKDATKRDVLQETSINQSVQAPTGAGKSLSNAATPERREGVVPLPNPPQRSKYAYTTLISGINKSFRYRGFLYNTLIMHKALMNLGSTADFIALIGYGDDDIAPYEEDMNLLRSNGIQVYVLPRFLDPSSRLTFAEMALLKVTPWSFTQYDRVQFFDGDVMPYKNMDCFFKLNHNSFTVGAVSPLNSGWYLAIPNAEDYRVLREKAIWRLNCDWHETIGWTEPITTVDLTVRGGKSIKHWHFNGADMDQGLLTHYFVMHKGKATLVDTDLNSARQFDQGMLSGYGDKARFTPTDAKLTMGQALSCCNGMKPTDFFAHFTGRSKPWMEPEDPARQADMIARKQGFVYQWMVHLDSLKLPHVNSSNIRDLQYGSPLGFWNVNFPKLNRPCHPNAGPQTGT